MLPLVEQLNAFAADWTRLGWAVLWQSTLLACLIALACRWVPRTSPAARCWLWQIVAFKLLLMPFWTLAVPLPDWFSQETGSREAPAVRTPSGEEGGPLLLPENDTSPAVTDVDPTGAQVEPDTRQLANAIGQLRWRSWLLLGWLLVVAGQTGRLLLQRRRLGQLLRQASPAAGTGLLGLVEELAGRLGLRRVPCVVFVDLDCSPFVCGLWRQTLVLPRGLLESLDAAQLRQVLLHELAHIRRGDLFWGWVPEIARLAWFFHPVAHWVCYRVRLERELACDQTAMALSGHGAADYAQTLLQVVTHTSQPDRLRLRDGVKESPHEHFVRSLDHGHD